MEVDNRTITIHRLVVSWKVKDTPRATPYKLARLPNIYVGKRYQ